MILPLWYPVVWILNKFGVEFALGCDIVSCIFPRLRYGLELKAIQATLHYMAQYLLMLAELNYTGQFELSYLVHEQNCNIRCIFKT